jgi:hypothetical protein
VRIAAILSPPSKAGNDTAVWVTNIEVPAVLVTALTTMGYVWPT